MFSLLYSLSRCWNEITMEPTTLPRVINSRLALRSIDYSGRNSGSVGKDRVKTQTCIKFCIGSRQSLETVITTRAINAVDNGKRDYARRGNSCRRNSLKGRELFLVMANRKRLVQTRIHTGPCARNILVSRRTSKVAVIEASLIATHVVFFIEAKKDARVCGNNLA